MRLGGRRAFVVAAASCWLGCGLHKDSVLARNFPHEVALYVAISDKVAKSDSGNVAAMLDVIEQELRAEGRLVTIIAAHDDEKPPLPRIELQVRESDAGDARMRGVGHLMNSPVGSALVIGGGGAMVVDAFVVTAVGQGRHLGRFSHGSFGAVSEEEVAAGHRTGGAIASRLKRP
jgi:hypothetical protein